ncbi:hypothetical protein EYF80_010584 [Liparis tanakae]|uniref:Uncharacterized protein n=1 Tax=Liparis tanakae TaxID=230148 RepID=A0A4Z2IML3_9TELE|nr:hypothetical protein EYF80_010584 [Liparis tanakae]
MCWGRPCVRQKEMVVVVMVVVVVVVAVPQDPICLDPDARLKGQRRNQVDKAKRQAVGVGHIHSAVGHKEGLKVPCAGFKTVLI